MTLQRLLDDFSHRTKIKTILVNSTFTALPSKPIATAVYRIVQECLSNITRHAKATRVEVELFCGERELDLTVRDNGVGFDMAAAQELGRALRFLGLWTTESAEEISSYDSGITLYEEEQRLAGTVTDGYAPEGFRVTWEYLWHAEHAVLLVWLAAVFGFWGLALHWLQAHLAQWEAAQWLLQLWPLSLVAAHAAAVLLVLASDFYDAGDYIRDYSEFLKVAAPKGESRV